MPKAKLMPHSIEAEQAILCCILIDNYTVADIVPVLTEEHFYSQAHQIIFANIKELYISRKPIDFVTLVDSLERCNKLGEVGGIDYITNLTYIVPSAVNYKNYLEIVRDSYILRQLIKASSEIINKAYNNVSQDNRDSELTFTDKAEVLQFAEKSIFDISREESSSDLTLITDSLKEVIKKFDTIARDRNSLKGLATGFAGLDRLTNGLQRSDLILIAARPGAGKTSIAMNIINYTSLHGAKVAVFSLEMPKVQLAQRSLCSVSGVSMEKALKGELSNEEWKKLWAANAKLSEAKIYVDDKSTNTPTDILSKCRRLMLKEGGLDLVMVDYLQLMSSGKKYGDGNRQQEVADISRNLKIIARELNVPIIVLSQLSRAVENRKDPDGGHRPVLSDLRESGAIEQDADIVMFVYRPDMYNDTLGQENREISELIIAKHRNGPQGTVKLKWNGATTSFENLESDMNMQSIMNTAPNIKPNNSSDGVIVDEIDEKDLPPVTPLSVNEDITDIFS